MTTTTSRSARTVSSLLANQFEIVVVCEHDRLQLRPLFRLASQAIPVRSLFWRKGYTCCPVRQPEANLSMGRPCLRNLEDRLFRCALRRLARSEGIATISLDAHASSSPLVVRRAVSEKTRRELSVRNSTSCEILPISLLSNVAIPAVPPSPVRSSRIVKESIDCEINPSKNSRDSFLLSPPFLDRTASTSIDDSCTVRFYFCFALTECFELHVFLKAPARSPFHRVFRNLQQCSFLQTCSS